MKLKSEFLTQQIGNQQVMVASDSRLFSGMVRSNKTAAVIIDYLKEDTSEEAIVEAMLARFDAPRPVIENDVQKVLTALRSISALEE